MIALPIQPNEKPNEQNKGELIISLKGHDRFIEIKTSRALGKETKCYHFKPE